MSQLNPWLQLELADQMMQDVLVSVGNGKERYLSDRVLAAKALEGFVHAATAIGAIRKIIEQDQR